MPVSFAERLLFQHMKQMNQYLTIYGTFVTFSFSSSTADHATNLRANTCEQIQPAQRQAAAGCGFRDGSSDRCRHPQPAQPCPGGEADAGHILAPVRSTRIPELRSLA